MPKIRLRSFFRIVASVGQRSDVWPSALLLGAVVVPALCLLWFMNAAMRNERLAARQQLADAYRGQLSGLQAQFTRQWNDSAARLEALALVTPASAAFASCVRSGAADSIVVLDERGHVLYPNTPIAIEPLPGEAGPKWTEANRLEYGAKEFAAAAKLYHSLSAESTNVHSAARALQAEARCLVQAGQPDAAVRVISEVLGDRRYDQAMDRQGRLIAANGELMALELLTNQSSPNFAVLTRRLTERVTDYDNPRLAAPQRRFLMKELQRLSPQTQLPALRAEELAAQVCENRTAFATEPGLHPTAIPDVWQLATPNGRAIGLIGTDTLLRRVEAMVAADTSLKTSAISLVPPGRESDATFVSVLAGDHLPGWRLALSLKDQKLFASTTEHRAATYLWTGALVMAAMGVLALLAFRIMRRQVALARLKNDLAATVSHELKTPLSSMRVLVDTLLGSNKLSEQTTREYLELIARENERLSRLIQNFLTFSRLEKKQQAFHFAPASVPKIVDMAVAAARQHFEIPGCRFDVQLENNLPDVLADPDALVTALANLLDNACKYSEEIKHIVLRARVENETVVFSVQDNGIGIAPRELKRIFRQFYQVDQSLSRKRGGCGLGLSIVRSIVNAHGGSVSVQSKPGSGSIFSFSVPIAPTNRGTKEAVA